MAQVDMEGEKQQKLRKAVSADVSYEMEKYCKIESDSTRIIPTIDEEVEEVECKCCGLKEECTSAYISEVEGGYCGEWLCGLCSAAVKERAGRDPQVSLQDALNLHRDFCLSYNTTTRLNPKLYLTLSMRDFAKKSLEKRKSKLARSTSYP
ncbi:uncharacterized protein LOC114734341 [Neltuma alba]|uniref:uncharacterized protein LOC114734341 n=1 Tax=Neltuma alba TaxID=207710 RepID=UPI0010A4F857|nr:uncharacterized protein LOC114734341 [Prosopis alba]